MTQPAKEGTPMSLKMLREDLCRRQVDDLPLDVATLVDVLIKRIDFHRPVGPDGSHGDLHTETCGCPDAPPPAVGPKYRVGQTVLWVISGRNARQVEVEVSRVGRSLVCITQRGREIAFYQDTGFERRDPNAAGLSDRIMTHADVVEEGRRTAALERLKKRHADYVSNQILVMETVADVLDGFDRGREVP